MKKNSCIHICHGIKNSILLTLIPFWLHGEITSGVTFFDNILELPYITESPKEINPEIDSLIPRLISGKLRTGWQPNLKMVTKEKIIEAKSPFQNYSLQHSPLKMLFILGNWRVETRQKYVSWNGKDKVNLQNHINRGSIGLQTLIPLKPSWGENFQFKINILQENFPQFETGIQYNGNSGYQLEFWFTKKNNFENITVEVEDLRTLNPLPIKYGSHSKSWKIFQNIRTHFGILKNRISWTAQNPSLDEGVHWIADSSRYLTMDTDWKGNQKILNNWSVKNELTIYSSENQGFRLPGDGDIKRFHYSHSEVYKNFFQLNHFIINSKEKSKRLSLGYLGIYSFSNPPKNAEQNFKEGFNYKRFNPNWFGLFGMSYADKWELFEHNLWAHSISIEFKEKTKIKLLNLEYSIPFIYTYTQFNFTRSEYNQRLFSIEKKPPSSHPDTKHILHSLPQLKLSLGYKNLEFGGLLKSLVIFNKDPFTNPKGKFDFNQSINYFTNNLSGGFEVNVHWK